MTWALVSGASGDIGSVVAARLAKDGFDIVVQTFRRVEAAERVAVAVREVGRQAIVLRANFGRPEDATRLAREAGERTGGIDALVVGAASGVMRPTTALTERHLDWALHVNARPLLQLTVVLEPRAVVALTSPGSVRVVPSYASVGVSKAALEAMVRYLAVELGPHTRVNALSVGLVDSRAARLLPDWEALRAASQARTPMGRLVTPDDVASAVGWLLSPASSMVTGATVVLDGGYGLSW